MFSIRVPLISAFKKQLSSLTTAFPAPTHKTPSVTWDLKNTLNRWGKKWKTDLNYLNKTFSASYFSPTISKGFFILFLYIYVKLRSYRVHYKQLFIRLRSYREKGHSLNSQPSTVHWIMCVCENVHIGVCRPFCLHIKHTFHPQLFWIHVHVKRHRKQMSIHVLSSKAFLPLPLLSVLALC